MKLKQDKDHNIICYSVGGYNFLTEEDANNFLSYVKWENVKVREIIYCIGIPNIVNWQLSLKKGYIVYYDDNFLLDIELRNSANARSSFKYLILVPQVALNRGGTAV